MGIGELNKRAVENYIKSGAMDSFGNHRSELLDAYEPMMDSLSSAKKRNLEGQMGLFGMADHDMVAPIKIESKPELSRAQIMLYEKETTGMYISGHPMDDYRVFLRNTHVVPIRDLMDEEKNYRDDQIVSVGGIVQSIKMKNTRSGSMMAYVTVEDDTGTMENLVFSNVLTQYGGYIKENAPVVITGRLSLRDEKDAQIVVNRVRPISDFANKEPAPDPQPAPQKILTGTLYLRLPTEESPLFRKVKAIIGMFPGNSQAVVYFADTKQRRGSRCDLDDRMLLELENILGKENVVVK